VRHVAVLGNDLEAFNRLGVADNVVEENGAVFFDPEKLLATSKSIS
jgi:hypothetical protein